MYTFLKNQEMSDQSQAFARWIRILGEATDFAPLTAELSNCETGLMPLTEMRPTGQRRPSLISFPTYVTRQLARS